MSSQDYERGKRAGRDGGQYKAPHGGDATFRFHTEKELKDREDYDGGYKTGREERERRQ